jgi:predicted patatin/cPLA2 family phospholipase
MKKSLVLEGGGMRGMYTAGVTDVFMENNINFDLIVGVSAGATFGCNVKSKQIGRTIRYNKRFCKDPRYSSFRSFIKTGDYFGAKFCYETLPNELDVFDTQTFKNSPEEFYVVCTDVKSGNPVYHQLKNGDAEDLIWMRASASMPLVSQTVQIDDLTLLDGGISDSIPLKFCQSLGAQKNLVVLTQPQGYQKSKNKLLPLIKRIYKKYPNLIKAINTRYKKYNDTLETIKGLENKKEIFVIRPSKKLNIKRIEKNITKMDLVYEQGLKDAKKHLKTLKKYIEK